MCVGCVGGGAPSGTDRCFPEVRGCPQTSRPASVGPGMVPAWTEDQGHFIRLDDLCPTAWRTHPRPAPGPFLAGFFSSSFCKHIPSCLTKFQLSTSPAIFCLLVSASGIEILFPSLHEELVKTGGKKKQEINVPASRLHTALDGIKAE